MRKYAIFLAVVFLAGCHQSNTDDISFYVNPFVGTGGHGHTFPGATVPFGMVQLSPDTRKDNWDACSGYHYSDSTIMGFSHTHLSGTGVGDYGDIRFMPLTGDLKLVPGDEKDPSGGYRSRFSHDNEAASPGYYRVFLRDYGINVELTATRRCGFHRYSVAGDRPLHIVIDLFESVTSDEVLGSAIEFISDHEVSGYRRTRGWAEDQTVYFYASFSEAFSQYGIAQGGITEAAAKAKSGTNLQAYVSFPKVIQDYLTVKVGISAVSVEGARRNLEAEIGEQDFDMVKKRAHDEWNRELSKIEIRKGADSNRVKFYTALYHSFIAPNVFSDSDGSYRGQDRQVYPGGGHEMYTVFSLWDTYRALHPLMTLVQPEKTVQFIQTMMDIYKTGGLLPVWELAGNETFCMIGYHSVPVIADAIMKGYAGFDHLQALEAMKHSAGRDHFGLNAYRQYGYIPADEEGESVSKTLEYAYDDWCIAMVAKKLGRDVDYRTYIVRAQNYKNLYDPSSRFLRGKRNGMFVEPFDPAEVNFMLTEANTWQYTFYVPQDIRGLMDLMGGQEAFADRLDEMFTTSSDLAGREQADITGLIGQYAHGNEPSHHMAYLFSYAGKPYRTQQLVRQIMDKLYGTGPDGLCGNEDCGQMSAWFVLSAFGFYPVTPGSNLYVLGSPLFEEAEMELPTGEHFTVRAKNNSPENVYIQSATLDGAPLTRSYLSHDEVMKGGILELEMGSVPSGTWATDEQDLPRSEISDFLITPVPYYRAPGKTFRDSISVSIHSALPGAEIYFRTGDGQMDGVSQFYTLPVSSDETFRLAAVAVKDTMMTSLPAEGVFRKLHHLWTIRLSGEYSNQYTGGGDIAVIDGETGGVNFRTGGWQGYHGTDFEAVIDLGSKQAVRKMGARFLDDQNAWIFLPQEVEFAVADREGKYRVVASFIEPAEAHGDAAIQEYVREGGWEAVRYVRIKAKNTGTCPSWHKGAGSKAWLFIDEVIIE